MHPLTIAYQQWKDSQEGKTCHRMPGFTRGNLLENKIHCAFHAGATVQENLDKVVFVKRHGVMAECLGVDEALSQRMDEIVGRLIDAHKSQIEIVEHVRDYMQLNPSQFAAFMYSLGIYCGRKGH